ncbi:precorrin-3B synthase [Paraburkholderia humisilvae]|uniref:precorrin-3B synthase n=1 Tax=Paraburkholderia humisilvae TaxID=627669 RepID=UPI001581577F|nr:precorrin-3B synthase [Paraburkholderia humisilvae]
MNHAPAVTANSASQPPRGSACPGLLRIVAARDGGICRVKLPGGALSAAHAHAIADAAETHACGVIEMTNRANLQIRGVRAGEEHALIERLLAAGLGPHAPAAEGTSAARFANPAADDVRNLMISPTAGRDPAALIDTSGLAAQILTLLQSEARFAALSPKFALLLDGGEQLAMLTHPHDIWLAALQDEVGDGVRFAFGLAGCPPVAPNDPAALAAVRPEHVVALIDALLHTFLDLAAPDEMRMRDLLARQSAASVLARIDARAGFPLLRDAQISAWRRPRAQPALRFGVRPQREPGMSHVGGSPPLGRIDAPTLRALAALSQEAGKGILRMTPWQSVLLPDVPAQAAPAALARLTSLGFACDRAQPFARLIACAGSPGCAKAHADTKADAQQLARRLPADAEVHLSGCTRSCAAAHPVPFTLLAVAPGRYDLYQHDPANAVAVADLAPRFGHCIAQHLTIEHAADRLDRLSRSAPDA